MLGVSKHIDECAAGLTPQFTIFPFYIYIYLSGFHTRCLYWFSRRPSPGSNYSASPPMKLMTSQSFPQSFASSVMIMSHRNDLAGLARRKNFLTLHYFLTWNSDQSDKISLPYPLVFTQKKEATHPRIGLGLGSLLTPRKTPSPQFFFSATLAWTLAMPVFKRKLSGHLLAKSHRYTYIYIFEFVFNAARSALNGAWWPKFHGKGLK